MMKYYVDRRTNEVEKDLNTDFLAPELFYEYKNSGDEDLVVETWSGTGNCSQLDISYNPDQYVSFADIYEMRTKLFNHNDFKPINLIAYAVPPTWFKAQTEHL